MTIDFQTATFIIGLLIAWSAFLVGIIKALFTRQVSQLEASIGNLQKKLDELEGHQGNIRVTMPEKYVTKESCNHCREEWMRSINTVSHKLDVVSDRILNRLDDLRKEVYKS